MTKLRKNHKLTKNETEVLEFLKTARELKRQIMLIKGIGLTSDEEQVVGKVLKELTSEMALYKA